MSKKEGKVQGGDVLCNGMLTKTKEKLVLSRANPAKTRGPLNPKYCLFLSVVTSVTSVTVVVTV